MERYAIVVAGGHGARMSSEIPKQFLPLCGEPVLAHTLRKFGSIGTEPILVLHPDWINYWKDISKTLDRLPLHRIVPGSTTRAGSVYNGLNALPVNGLVAVHDAARPLISNSLISNQGPGGIMKTPSRSSNAGIPFVNSTATIPEP